MKKTKKILAALLSATMAAVLVSGSAMAAEAQNTTGADNESVVSTEDEAERLRRINPHITDEDWEIIERFEELEANGSILVGETERSENGLRIVESYYLDAINPLSSNTKTYRAITQVFQNADGNTSGELVLKTYLHADFTYDSEENSVDVVRSSVWKNTIVYYKGEESDLKIIDGGEAEGVEVPLYIYSKKYEDGIYVCTIDYTTKARWYNTRYMLYHTEISVASNGDCRSKGLQNVGV